MNKTISPDTIPEEFIIPLNDSFRATADKGVAAIINSKTLFAKMYEISFTMPYPINIRAARIIQLCVHEKPELFENYVDNTIKHIAFAKAGGVKRSYLKILFEHTELKEIKEPGVLAKLCFDWLMCMKEDTAVLIYCMEILYKMSKWEPDILYELSAIIDFRKEYGTVAFKNRAIKIHNEFMNQKRIKTLFGGSSEKLT